MQHLHTIKWSVLLLLRFVIVVPLCCQVAGRRPALAATPASAMHITAKVLLVGSRTGLHGMPWYKKRTRGAGSLR
jgi:hypothetical protein